MSNTGNLEIEKKFILHGDLWKEHVVDEGMHIEQYYLVDTLTSGITHSFVSRIRIIDGATAVMTTKVSYPSSGSLRVEVECPMDIDIAKQLLGSVMPPCLVKRRFRIPIDLGSFFQEKNVLEVDVFEGMNTGLVIGEIEFDSENESRQHIISRLLACELEYTSDLYKATLNSNLVKTPYRNWSLGLKERYQNLRGIAPIAGVEF